MNNTPSHGEGKSDLGGEPLEDITFIVDLADEDGNLPPGFRLPGDPEPEDDDNDDGDDDLDGDDDGERTVRLRGFDDLNDALDLKEFLDGSAIFVEGIGWFCYDEAAAVWRPTSVERGPLRDAESKFTLMAQRSAVIDFIETRQLDDRDPEKIAASKRMRHAETLGQDRKQISILNALSADPDVWLPIEVIDVAPGLAAPNAQIVVTPDEIVARPRAKEDLVTKTTVGKWRQDLVDLHGIGWWRDTAWGEFQQRVRPDPEILEYHMKMMGYSIFTKGNPDQIAYALIGRSGSGKSIEADRSREALGDLSTTFRATLLKHKKNGNEHTEDLLQVIDKSAIFGDEFGGPSVRVHIEIFKSYTNSSQLGLRRIFKGEYRGTINFVMIFTTNDPIQFAGMGSADPATQRRLVYSPMNAERLTQHEGERFGARLLKDQESRDAMIAFWAEGYQRYLMDKQRGISLLDMPPALQEFNDTIWRDSYGIISDWAYDALDITGDNGIFTPSNVLHQELSTYCSIHGYGRPPTMKQMTQALIALGASLGEPGEDGRYKNRTRVDGHPVRVVYGVGLIGSKPLKG